MFTTTGTRKKLSGDQETRLCNFIKYRSQIGCGVTRPEIGVIIKEILDSAERDADVSLIDEE